MSEIELPPHWKGISFGKICILRKESVKPTDEPDIAYVGLEHIDSGNPKLTRWGSPSEVKSSKSKFYHDDILYGKLRPYLDKAVLAELTGICSTDILVFKAKELIKPEFLIYLVHTKAFINYAIKTTRGVNHPRTSWTSLVQLEIPLPPLPEQKSIAHTLQTIQKAKETRQRELELEHERKAALMQYLFTHGTRNEPRKQTEIGEIPESWDVVKLELFCKLLQYGTSKRCDLDSTGIPVLRIPNIIRGDIDTSDLKYTKPDKKEFEKLSLEVGDLLFVRTNGRKEYLGRCAVFSGQPINAMFASYLIRVKLKPNTLLPKFVQFYTMTHKGKSYLSGRASNAADGKFNINTQTIKAVLVPFPPRDEQKEIIETLQTCDRKIKTLEKEISLTDELFHAMLEQLMTGQISTKNLSEIQV